MPMIAVDLIKLGAENDVRRHAASAADDAGLRASIEALGILQPVLLRPEGKKNYMLIAGRRRLAAARAIGMSEIPAHIEANFPGTHALAAAAAENMVRASLSPLDQWRAMVDLQAGGYKLAGAAAALGLSERHARKLDRLGRLHPDILARIEVAGMPGVDDLGKIANAPAEQQAKALAAAVKQHGHKLEWRHVAFGVSDTRIPRSRAIFDLDQAGVPFEEDLFAQPGDDDAVYTTDVAGFLAAQQAALTARIAAAGGTLKPATWTKGGYAIPKGWTEVYADLAEPPAKRMTRFAVVALDGHSLGAVVTRDCRPEQAKAAKGAKGKASGRDDADSEDGDDGEAGKPAAGLAVDQDTAAEPADAPIVSAAGREMIARAKTTALRAKLLALAGRIDPDTLFAYVVLALGAANVAVTDPLTRRRIDFAGYAAAIVPPPGAVGMLCADARQAAATALADILIVATDPATTGPPVEWIGHHCGAGSLLPRFDTPVFLATVATAELKRLAGAVGLKPAKTAAGLRAQLVNALPDWRPPGAEFGAAGPTPA